MAQTREEGMAQWNALLNTLLIIGHHA